MSSMTFSSVSSLCLYWLSGFIADAPYLFTSPL